MIRRPPRSTLFPHDALPIYSEYIFRLTNGNVRTLRHSPWQLIHVPSRAEFEIASRLAEQGIAGRVPVIYGDRLYQARKSTRLNSSHMSFSYAAFCFKNNTCC